MTLTLVQYAMDFGIVVVFAGMLLCVARLLKGPHLADRAIAADEGQAVRELDELKGRLMTEVFR